MGNNSIGVRYTLRFRQQVESFGREQGLLVYDGSYRVQLYFEEDAIRIRQADGTTQRTGFALGTALHEFELLVDSGTALLFVDSQLVADWNLQALSNYGSRRIAHWVKGPAPAVIVVDGTDYIDGNPFLRKSKWLGGGSLSPWQASGSVTATSQGAQLSAGVDELTKLQLSLTGLDSSRVHFRRTVGMVPNSLFLGEQGFALYSGGARTVVYIERDGVRVRAMGYDANNQPDSNNDVSFSLVKWDPSEATQSHDYEVVTRGGKGLLYVDGAFAGEWERGPSSAASDRLYHWVKGTNGVSPQSVVEHTFVMPYRGERADRLVFDFEADELGEPASFWRETDVADTWYGSEWKVQDGDPSDPTNRVYGRANSKWNSAGSISTLHYFARDVTFSGRFLIRSHGTNYRWGVQARRNTQDARLWFEEQSGAPQQWCLHEDTGPDADRPHRRVGTCLSNVNVLDGQWHTFKLGLSGNDYWYGIDSTCTATVRNSTCISGTGLRHESFGQLALMARGADVIWDDIVIEQENAENGRALAGVSEHAFGNGSRGAIVGLSDGSLLAHAPGGAIRSSDGGDSWEAATGKSLSANILVMNDGRLLKVKPTSRECDDTMGQLSKKKEDGCPCGYSRPVAWLSEDNGETWGDEIAISAFVGGNWPYTATYIECHALSTTMPNKLTQDSLGRIFLGWNYCEDPADAPNGHCSSAAGNMVYTTDNPENGMGITADPWDHQITPSGPRLTRYASGYPGISSVWSLVGLTANPPNAPGGTRVDKYWTDNFYFYGHPYRVQEPMVVEVDPDNHVHKLYIRSGLGYLLEAESTDGGITFGELKPSHFRSSRTSFNVRRDSATGNVYMAWEYNDSRRSFERDGTPPAEIVGSALDRFRIGLAVSTDNTKTWKFIGDVDDFWSEQDRHLNHGLNVIGDQLWVSVARKEFANKFEVDDMGNEVCKPGSNPCERISNPTTIRFWRFDISKFEPSARFPGAH